MIATGGISQDFKLSRRLQSMLTDRRPWNKNVLRSCPQANARV